VEPVEERNREIAQWLPLILRMSSRRRQSDPNRRENAGKTAADQEGEKLKLPGRTLYMLDFASA